MTTEGKPKEKSDERREEDLLTSVTYVIVDFLTVQNLSDTKTACTENSNRFGHHPIGFMSDFCSCGKH
jgi:hypothetical protein